MKVTVNRTANAPADVLWKYLADFSKVDRFHPFLKGSHFLNGSNTCEVGSTRQCDFKDGNYAHERITDLVEGSHYTIDILESSMPMTDVSATLGVNSLATGKTNTYMTMKLKPKNQLLQPMIYLNFKYKLMPAILKGLEDLYIEEYQNEEELSMA